MGRKITNFRNKLLIPDPKIGDDERPLAKALPTDVLVDPDSRGKVFCYIDDLITVGLFTESWQRLAHVIAVILDVFARPVHVNEPIHRDDLLSMKKLKAEGSLEEKKTILGWDIDFHDLSAALTKDKFEEWSADLERVIAEEETTIKELDTIIRKCASMILVFPFTD